MKRKLSSNMENALIKILQNNSVEQIPVATIKALENRKLIFNRRLTSNGSIAAIDRLPLEKQCDYLNINIETYECLKIFENPEENAMAIFKAKGFDSVWTEGRVVLLGIHALSLPTLKKINILGELDACSRYIEAQFTIHKDKLNNIIEDSTRIKFQEFYTYYKIVNQQIMKIQDFIVIPDAFIEKVYELLHNNLEQIFNWFASNPYGFRSGWPDLMIYNNKVIKQIEVKNKDKLITSQIEIIPHLINLGFNCEVIKLKYQKCLKTIST
jgi:hypothetical protein